MTKKTWVSSVILFTVFGAISNSHAASRSGSSVYFGVDGIYSHVKNNYSTNLNSASQAYNGETVDADSAGYGFNLGLRREFGGPTVALEAFYDDLNNVSKDPLIATDKHSILTQNAMTVDNRYGVKFNLGFKFADKVEIFGTAGITNIRYRYDRYDLQYGLSSNGTAFKAGTSMFVPIYGGGIRWNLTNSLSARALYEIQQMKNQYSREGEVLKSKIATGKIGLAYDF